MSVKLSAAPNYSPEAYPFRDMTPHIKRLFDAFGPQRCYWGTDMTNGFDKATYQQRITHFTEELPFLSEERQGLGDGPRDPAAAQLDVAADTIGTPVRAQVARPASSGSAPPRASQRRDGAPPEPKRVCFVLPSVTLDR